MAQQYGLGNFVYEVEVKDGKAHFSFHDPWDASNTADVTVDSSEFEGFAADSRQVADKAYDQCQRVLNEKRDARLKKEAEDAVEKKTDEDAKARQTAQDFMASTSDTVVEPATVEKDGTHVYNTENVPGAVVNPTDVRESGASSSDDSKKKK